MDFLKMKSSALGKYDMKDKLKLEGNIAKHI